MQPGKKYVASDGVQYAMYPNPVMNITQSINGSYSHMGTNAIDDAQQDTGISNGYAPADMVCVGTDYVNGNAMFWQSQRKVRTRKYGDCIISMMVIHDNTANAYVGMKIPQGSQLFSEGTMGKATGNHNHIEVAPVAFTRMYVLNSRGIYMMPNNVNPADIFFVDDTRIINGGGLNWAKISTSSSPSPSSLIQEDGVATLTVDGIRARLNNANGDVVRTYNSGDKIRYYWKWIGNGHRYIVWKEGNNYIYLAVSGTEVAGQDPWATFSEPEDSKPVEKPAEPAKPSTPDLIQEDGVATLTVDGIRARLNGPNGDVVRTYNSNDKIRYYWKWIGNGHRYIVWKEGNNYIYLAVSGTEVAGQDPWATFSEPEDSKPIEKPVEPAKPSTPVEDDGMEEAENIDLEPVVLESQYGLNITKALVDKTIYKYKCHYVMNPEFIVIHNAGTNGNPSAQSLNKAMGSNKEQKSWHFSVDENGAYQGLPINRNGWHAGDGKDGNGNRKGIAIEICRDMYDDGSNTYKLTKGTSDERFDKAKDNGALLAAILLYKYNWDISHVKKHQDFMNKYCPHHILNDGWDKFLKQVQSHLDNIIEANKPVEKPAEPEKPVEPVEPDTPVKPEEPETDEKTLYETIMDLLGRLVKVIIDFFTTKK